MRNSSSNIVSKMLSSIGLPGINSVRNSSSNIVSKMLTSIGLPGIISLLNIWLKSDYKMQHNIKLLGRHSPRNRGNINYNSK